MKLHYYYFNIEDYKLISWYIIHFYEFEYIRWIKKGGQFVFVCCYGQRVNAVRWVGMRCGAVRVFICYSLVYSSPLFFKFAIVHNIGTKNNVCCCYCCSCSCSSSQNNANYLNCSNMLKQFVDWTILIVNLYNCPKWSKWL